MPVDTPALECKLLFHSPQKLGLEVCLAVVWSLGESPGVEPSPLAEISGVVGIQDMV